jgi:hypothetical protein
MRTNQPALLKDFPDTSRVLIHPLTMKTMLHLLAGLVAAFCAGHASRAAEPGSKPVLLYSRYFNAQGEERYQPEGTFKPFLDQLRTHFQVVTHNFPLTAKTLANVDVVLVANPSDKAVKNNPPPHHFDKTSISAITKFVQNGGGFIILGNQENHNLEVEDTNKLLSNFGLQFTNVYTDAKKLVIPKAAPIIGGLRWAYYTGNRVDIQPQHPAHPKVLVQNDLAQRPAKGDRDAEGALLAIAEPGQGRVIVATDAGWLTDSALDGRGIGGVAIQEQDNFEIFLRLAKWAAHK